MKKQKIKDIKKIKKDIYKGYYDNKVCFLIQNIVVQDLELKHISIWGIKTLGVDSTLISIKNKENVEVFELLITSYPNISRDINKILSLFEKLKNNDFRKLRGDFAEVYFILKFGGTKILNEKKYDILKNKNYFEIKSFSIYKRTTFIKNSQINDSVKIIGIGLEMDNNGKNILELIAKLTNNDFKSSLFKKYNNSIYKELKFKVVETLLLKPKKMLIPFGALDATIEFEINLISSGEYLDE